jgi:hypothetical protein
MARCACLKRSPVPRLSTQERAPLVAAAISASHELAAIPDYPLEKLARKAIADALIGMCSAPEQVQYVVRRAVALHRSWKQCGVPGLRQILIAKYRSRDGIESGPECISKAYPEGIPGERDGLTGYEAEQQQISQSWPTGGLLDSGDVQFDEKLHHLAAIKRIASK